MSDVLMLAYIRMQLEHAQRAARNNAEWCDAVCRAAGAPGRFEADCWVCPVRVPRYYPNLVSLAGDGARVEQVVDGLLASGLPGAWGVKDSFDQLQLASRGFACLFEAHWLWREPDTRAEHASGWRRVESAAELRAWSLALDAHGESPFEEALLRDPRIAFLYLEADGQIVAGLAANLAAGVVGITNVFAFPAWAQQLTAALARVAQLFPGAAQVCGGREPRSLRSGSRGRRCD